MSRHAAWVHPLSERAVPMVGVDRLTFIDAIEAAGWKLYMDSGTGLYYRHPDQPGRALWISWQWEYEGRSEWFTEMIVPDKEEKPA